MNNNAPQTSIYAKLMCYFLLSAVIAIVAYMAVFHMLKNHIETASLRPEAAQTHACRQANTLQAFIEKNGIARTNAKALALWNDDNWYTSMRIVGQDSEAVVYYDSFLHYSGEAEAKEPPSVKDLAVSKGPSSSKGPFGSKGPSGAKAQSGGQSVSGDPAGVTAQSGGQSASGDPSGAKAQSGGQSPLSSKQKKHLSANGTPYPIFTFPLHFSDGSAMLTISGPIADHNGIPYTLTSSLVFILVFACCFFLLSRRRFLYIQELTKGVDTICQGNLSYAVSVDGNDELASLATHINEMNQSLQEQFRIEADMRKQNSAVVASLSHDLRTPLTAVICYLDLLHDERYQDADAMKQYIAAARSRAYQIKSMADELFSRSVQKAGEEVMRWETCNGNELISQILSEMHYSLNENGFKAQFNYAFSQSFTMEADITGFRRIFDNLASNIIKYADPTLAVSLSAVLENGFLHINQRNVKASIPSVCESAGLGLAAARRLVLLHGGSFKVTDNPLIFAIDVSFPVVCETNNKAQGSPPSL